MAQSRATLSLRGTVILCALSGALLSLCVPPAGWWFLAWVALVPWVAALRLGRGWASLVGSWVGGAVFFGALVYWLYLFGISVWLLAAALLALWLVAWGMLVRWTGRMGALPRMAAPAVLWCGVEWARGLGPYGFTWGWLGYSQSPAPEVLPTARLLGTLGLSFAIALVNAAVAEVVVGVRRREAGWPTLARAAGAIGAAAVIVVGARAWARSLPGPRGPEIRAAVVQGSTHGPLRPADVNTSLTAQEEKEALDRYGALTREAARKRPALIVWPESTIPGPPEEEPGIGARVSQIARASDAWLLAGGPYEDERRRVFNSAYLYSPTGNVTARYDKVQLVPFGEWVPGRSWLPVLSRYNVREFDFAAGGAHRVLQAGTIAVGPMICFESSFPQIAWQLSARRAQVLVVITNDAWFGHTAAAAQHLQVAELRAVETGRWVLRGASTGISAIIAPDGRVVARAGLYERKTLSAEIRLVTDERPAPRWGPQFAWLMVGLSVAYAILPLAAPRGGGEGRGRRRARAKGKGRKSGKGG